MALTQQQLNQFDHDFRLYLETDLVWYEPLPGEKEPEYTARVLAPQVENFMERLHHPSLHLRSDGSVRPLPVMFQGQAFYPDIAITDFNAREAAIEVKLLASSSFSDGMTKAIGQAVAYRSGGYSRSYVLLVSKDGSELFSQSGEKNLNEILGGMGIYLHVLRG